MKPIDIFLQGHGLTDIAVLTANPNETIANILAKLDGTNTKADDHLVFLEDIAAPLDTDAVIEELLPIAPEGDAVGPLRLHLTKCRKVAVVIRFNGEEVKRQFPPSATIARVHRWAARRAFGLSPRDAAEHVLQIQGTTTRPDRDVHIGTLTDGTACAVAFDLVPRKRVEG